MGATLAPATPSGGSCTCRDPQFIVSAPLDERPTDDAEKALVAQYDDGGGTRRVTLRLPEGLRALVGPRGSGDVTVYRANPAHETAAAT